MAEIVFAAVAMRQWAKLSPDVRKRINGKLSSYAKSGTGDVKRLKGRDGCRLRVGDWRVIFIEDEARSRRGRKPQKYL